MKFARTKIATALACALGLAGTVLLASAPAGAQDIRVEVTGSNIKRVDTEGVAPVQTITRQEIEQSGRSTVAEVLRSITANSGNSFSETFTNSFSKGASGISLRGLGQKSTLVLLNGRRMANYGFAQNLQDTYVDLNSIPSAAIERIEILKDGASAVYGSDAIGGVVNIILRQDYQGAEVTASAGISSESDLNEYRVALAGGMGQLSRDKYNILATFDYFKRDQIVAADRPFLAQQDFRAIPGGNFDNSLNAGTYRRPSSTRAPFATCPANQVFDIHQFPGTSTLNGSGCAYNPAPFIALFPEAERVAFLTHGEIQFSPNITGFAELSLSSTKTNQTSTPAPFGATSVAFDPTTGGVRRISNILPISNPNNPFPTGVTGIQYSFFDVGPRDSEITSDSGRLLAGLKGSVRNWDWEVAGGHSESKDKQRDFNRVNAFVLTQVVADGTYNFLNPSATPAVTQALRVNPTRNSKSKLDFADAKISSDLAQLPAGPLGFAAGIEYRRESIDDRPDVLLTSGAVVGQGATGSVGSRNVLAGYLELRVPIVKTLEAQLAVRHDRYSDFGNATSPKVGLRWTPVKELLLRGSYSEGFRAPTLPENSKGSSTFFVNVSDTDPTSQQFGTVQSVAGVFQANPELKAEKSKNLNLGFVLEPVTDLSFGLDYYKIRQNDVITANGFQFIVDNADKFPGQVVRDPTQGNIIVFVSDKFRNLIFVETSGFDFDFKKVIRTETAGKFTVASSWSYILHYKSILAVGEPVGDFVDSNEFGQSFPRYRGNISLTWERGPWTSSLNYRYINGWDQFNAAVPPAQARVGSYKDADLYLAYEGFKNLKIFGSVQNLLDTSPPFDPSETNRWDFSQHDWRGRYFTLGLKYTFK